MKLTLKTLFLCLWSLAAFAEPKLFVPAEVKPKEKVPEAVAEGQVADEFEDLLSDEPSEPAPSAAAAAPTTSAGVAAPKDDVPVVTWEVESEKMREPAQVKGKTAKGPSQGKLGDTLDDVPQPTLDLAPVDWDLDSSELPQNEVPVVSEVAIILSSQNFFPRKVHLAAGKEARIYFTTTNKDPAALIIERMNIQRWIAKDGGAIKQNDIGRAPWEFTKELNMKRLTEIIITPRKGTYVFYDALTGARGEIVVE